MIHFAMAVIIGILLLLVLVYGVAKLRARFVAQSDVSC